MKPCHFHRIVRAECSPAPIELGPSFQRATPMPMGSFAEGDRVRAPRRPAFPDGTVLKLMNLGYVLVRWDSDSLETAHCSELVEAGEDVDQAKD